MSLSKHSVLLAVVDRKRVRGKYRLPSVLLTAIHSRTRYCGEMVDRLCVICYRLTAQCTWYTHIYIYSNNARFGPIRVFFSAWELRLLEDKQVDDSIVGNDLLRRRSPVNAICTVPHAKQQIRQWFVGNNVSCFWVSLGQAHFAHLFLLAKQKQTWVASSWVIVNNQ